MAEKDYYKILGVSKNDSDVVITQAYRQLAKIYHPDYNPDNPVAAEIFKNVSEAADVLRNPDKKELYDNQNVENHYANNGIFNYFSKSLEELKELWVEAGIEIECKNTTKKMPLNHIYTSNGEFKRKNTNGIHINDII